MKDQHNEEHERLDRLTKTFFYNIGYEHVNNICDEANQLLRKHEHIKISKSLNNWFYNNYLEKFNKKPYKKKIMKNSKNITRRVAIILMVICTAFTIMITSVEGFRIQFFNMIIETNKQFTAVNFKENRNIDYLGKRPKNWENYYYPTILPKCLSFKSAFEANNTKYIIFTDGQDNEVHFVQGTVTADFQIDSEYGQVLDVDINGDNGIIIEKNDLSIISWHNNDSSFYLQGYLEKSILLEIAESIEKKQ